MGRPFRFSAVYFKILFFLDKLLPITYIQIQLINLILTVIRIIMRGDKMVKADPKTSCCIDVSKTASCCRVESLISVDERGQMVLPKELREKANIKAGDKLALISWEKDVGYCCLTLIKADNLADRVKEFLGPVMSNLGGMENERRRNQEGG